TSAPRPWDPFRPMASACTTWPGTFGSGARTNGTVRCSDSDLIPCVVECYDHCCCLPLCFLRVRTMNATCAPRFSCGGPALRLFRLVWRPALRTIPSPRGLPCGSHYLREGDLCGFLCSAVPTATGRGLPGGFPAGRRLTARRRLHGRRPHQRLCRG